MYYLIRGSESNGVVSVMVVALTAMLVVPEAAVANWSFSWMLELQKGE